MTTKLFKESPAHHKEKTRRNGENEEEFQSNLFMPEQASVMEYTAGCRPRQGIDRNQATHAR
jgi:hypothetical protein